MQEAFTDVFEHNALPARTLVLLALLVADRRVLDVLRLQVCQRGPLIQATQVEPGTVKRRKKKYSHHP